jgi:1-aminocyclopropane-1-carboxylate deaminase/D-cysteine desulfhydrase-like pyridoxal-dependent ACC family enzyme
VAGSTASVPPPPPRWTGDQAQDFPAMVEYLNSFYRAAVVEGYFANDATVQAIAQETVDPTQATAASAQETANSALTLAQTVNTRTQYNDAGSVTISNAATTAVVAIETQPNTSYYVTFGGSAFTGAPGATAFVVVTLAKTTTQFTLTLAAAPGVGNSVTLDWHVAR